MIENEDSTKELLKKKNAFDKNKLKSNFMNFFLIKYFIKIFSIFYAKMIKVSTKDIFILDAVNDEEYLKNKSQYKMFDSYYDSENFVYTLAPKKTIGYSLSHIGKEFKKVMDKNALLIIAEETREDFEFYFINTGEFYNKDSMGYLSIPKDEYLADDKRLEYALIYYLFLIEDKEIYIMSEKKLEFFTGFEKYVRYLRKSEIFQILIRTDLLDKSSSKLIKVVIMIALVIGTVIGFNFLNVEVETKTKADHMLKERRLQSNISEQSEITEKIVKDKEELVRFLNDGKEVLKD